MKLIIDELEAFPPNANPFCEDSFHMGQNIAKDVMMMFPHHTSEGMKYLIFVHTPTGKRVRVNFYFEEETEEG